LALVLVIGCRSKNPNAAASVSGKVTYKGAPVPGGSIVFRPQSGNYAGGLTPDGSYSITDMPSGDMTVTVETESVKPKAAPTGGMGAKMAKMASPIPESAKNAPKAEYVKIPAKYADPKTSPLKVTLKDGNNPNTNYDLTD